MPQGELGSRIRRAHKTEVATLREIIRSFQRAGVPQHKRSSTDA
jgi:hypothetical protein